MTTRIAWAITGAGCWLLESFAILGKILKNSKVKVDLFFSEAGREVAQNYGVFKVPVPENIPFIDIARDMPNFNEEVFREDFVKNYQWLGEKDHEEISDSQDEPSEISDDINFDELFNDVILELDEGSCFPTAASAANNRYDLIIISPATGNTVAKIAYGIADTLVSNLAIMGSKSKKTKIVIVPTDFTSGEIVSYLPIMLHTDTCKKCDECSSMWACKTGAIRRKRGKVRVNRLKCIGCLDCVRYCQHGIITFLEEIKVNVREREVENAKKLAQQEGFFVLEKPEEIISFLKRNFDLSL